jgi:hypothetical protein
MTLDKNQLNFNNRLNSILARFHLITVNLLIVINNKDDGGNKHDKRIDYG